MLTRRRLQYGIPAVIALGVVAARPAPRHYAGCAPRNAHTNVVIASATKTVSTMVKPQLQSLGWQAVPTAFIVETVGSQCDAVVAAHNAYASDADYKVTSPVIVRADHTWLVEVPPSPKRVETIIFVYDSALKFKTIF